MQIENDKNILNIKDSKENILDIKTIFNAQTNEMNNRRSFLKDSRLF